jgi:hypothetical protein
MKSITELRNQSFNELAAPAAAESAAVGNSDDWLAGSESAMQQQQPNQGTGGINLNRQLPQMLNDIAPPPADSPPQTMMMRDSAIYQSAKAPLPVTQSPPQPSQPRPRSQRQSQRKSTAASAWNTVRVRDSADFNQPIPPEKHPQFYERTIKPQPPKQPSSTPKQEQPTPSPQARRIKDAVGTKFVIVQPLASQAILEDDDSEGPRLVSIRGSQTIKKQLRMALAGEFGESNANGTAKNRERPLSTRLAQLQMADKKQQMVTGSSKTMPVESKKPVAEINTAVRSSLADEYDFISGYLSPQGPRASFAQRLEDKASNK